MKKTLIALLFLVSTNSIAQTMEIVNCTDNSGYWKVNFALEGKLVSGLQFIYFNQIVASFPIMRAIVNQVGSKTYYDINFNPIYYFDFERVTGSKKLQGAFFIPQDPSGFENYVTCDAL